MKINFLSATDGTRLTKSIEKLEDGRYKTDSYPMVGRFNSFERNISSLQEMHDMLVTHANEGLCVLKGELKTPLRNESRAGQTDAHQQTEWLCLDIDFDLYQPIPEFIDSLDPAFKNASYIKQDSSSHGLSEKSGWRGHLFILLSSPVPPSSIKNFLMEKNLNSPYLTEHLELSTGGSALKFPLDITTCQNDKLLYIAPPIYKNFDDPNKGAPRFSLEIREKERVNLIPQNNFAEVASSRDQKITALRKTSGLQTKKFNISYHPTTGTEILENPDAVMVTGVKTSKDFVYLNLNGGNSWGYFFPINNPEIVYNFKGEPGLYLKDVDKELFNRFNKPVSSSDEDVDDFQPFVCRNAPRDAYYNGIYYPQKGQVELYTASSKGKLKDFLAQYGMTMEEIIYDWDITFDPTSDETINFDKKWVNVYKPSTFIRNARVVDNPEIPPTILKVLNSLCGDEETLDHFINWLSCIVKLRVKIGTAWIFQGVQGTGKGLLFSSILQPLLGHEQCHEITMDRFDDQFNAYLEKNIVLFVDEAHVGDSKNGDRTLNKLKNLITEEELVVRAMRTNPVTVKSYTNCIFASNQHDSVPIEDSDRRMNVPARQETPLKITQTEVVNIKSEIQEFANYLLSYDANLDRAKKVRLTEAREQLIQAGRTTVASFFAAISTGNLDYFNQFLQDKTPADTSGLNYIAFQEVVRAWNKVAGTPSNVSRDDLKICYEYLQMTNGVISPTKFSRMCAKYGLNIEPIRIDSGVTRGIVQHIWKVDTEHEDKDLR